MSSLILRFFFLSSFLSLSGLGVSFALSVSSRSVSVFSSLSLLFLLFFFSGWTGIFLARWNILCFSMRSMNSTALSRESNVRSAPSFAFSAHHGESLTSASTAIEPEKYSTLWEWRNLVVLVATFLRTQWMIAFSSLVSGVSTFMLSAAFRPRGFFLSAMVTYEFRLKIEVLLRLQ